MITQAQIEALAKDSHIDSFTIMREYLQLLFLSYLYQEKEAGKIYFKGGTAIKLLLGSPRFSEDLDFSTIYTRKQTIRIIRKVEGVMQKELPELKIPLLYSGKKGIRFRIKYQPVDSKYPLVIRLDFNLMAKTEKTAISPLVTKFPIAIFPLISHLSDKQILSQKISALLSRDKGRDFFDIWFLLERNIPFDPKLLTKQLLKKIESYPQDKLDRDLAKFLPQPQRRITGMLKKLLVEKINILSLAPAR